MEKSSISVKQQLFDQFNNIAKLSSTTAEVIEQGVIDVKEPHFVDYTVDIVKKVPIVDAAWYGDVNGDFIIAETDENKTISSEIFNRTKSKPTPTHIILNRNLQGEIIRKINSTDFTYDPRQMFWYKEAKSLK